MQCISNIKLSTNISRGICHHDNNNTDMWLQELGRKMVPKSFVLNFTDYFEHSRFLIASLRKNWMLYHTTIESLSKDVTLVNRK